MRLVCTILLGAVMLVSFVGASPAATPWVLVNTSGSTYGMSDINEHLSAINDLVGPGQPQFDMIERGVQFGVGGGFDLARGVSLGLGYEHLAARSILSNQLGSVMYDLPADLVRMFAEFSPATEGRLGLLAGVSVGWIMENGDITVTSPPDPEYIVNIEGEGFSGEVYAGGRMSFSPRFALLGTLGYRFADVGNVTQQRQDVVNADGSDLTVDFSGVFLRLGLKTTIHD